jgi:uncharacterized protein
MKKARKKVIFDLGHPAHVNLYKNFISILDKEEIDCFISVLDRGKVVKIAEKELSGKRIFVTGKHKGNLWSIIFQANILKFLKLIILIFKEKPTVGFGTGYILGGAMSLFNKRSYQFDDDPERKWVVFLEKHLSTQVFFPPIIEAYKDKKITVFNALKEWSYLSPTYFVPNIDVLKEYNLEAKNYIFIREVSSGSVNYMGQAEGLILSIANQIPSAFNVILSLENKSLLSKYPSHWIVLNEPVNDIHSLIFYSKVLISSGDSMAREGAMLGVPSIYCGFRTMKANKIMQEHNMLFHVEINEVPIAIRNYFNNTAFESNQIKFREKLKNEWVDIPEMMYNLIK